MPSVLENIPPPKLLASEKTSLPTTSKWMLLVGLLLSLLLLSRQLSRQAEQLPVLGRLAPTAPPMREVLPHLARKPLGQQVLRVIGCYIPSLSL